MRSTAIACSYLCAKAYVDAKNAKMKVQKAKLEAKIERQLTKERKEKLKTKREKQNETQTVFNAFIRERDKDLPCISCGRHHQGQYHAGHYRSVGAAPQLRFDEMNVHKQCQPCNTHKSGNAIEYRINLIKKIGLQEVERLESENQVKKWSDDELKDIKQYYNQKLKLLRKGVT